VDNVVVWLSEWFKRKVSKDKDISQYLEVNYFEAGFIDSLGIFELILAIERNYNIRFSEKHFQDRRFATISGLAAIISELVITGGKSQ